MVSYFFIASHAHSRSARAPVPKLLEIRSRWSLLPRRATSLSHPTAFALALAPSPRRRVFIYFRRSQPARMVAL
eukprot:1822473-Pleurochrysis_carterae.AAC.1